MVGKNLKRTKTFEVETIGLLPTVAKHRQHFLLVSRNRIQSRRHSTCALVNAYCMSVLRIVLTYLKKFTLRPPVIPGSTLRVRSSKKGSFPRQVWWALNHLTKHVLVCKYLFEIDLHHVTKEVVPPMNEKWNYFTLEKSSKYKWARVAYWCFSRCH